MASRKSNIPVKKPVGGQTSSSPQPSMLLQSNSSRQSGIPRLQKPGVGNKFGTSGTLPKSTSNKDDVLRKEIEKLKEDVQTKDLTIEDLNNKLMETIKEKQVLNEEKDTTMEQLKISRNVEEQETIKKLQKLLEEKDDQLQDVKLLKEENERKFEVELDMLKNQHEIEILSLQERLQQTYQEKLQGLESSLQDEKAINQKLREDLEGTGEQGKSAENTVVQGELGKTKQRYGNVMGELKQKLKSTEGDQEGTSGNEEGKGNTGIQLDHEKEIQRLKEAHQEEVETINYLVQEKDFIINDLKQQLEKEVKNEDGLELQHDKLYSEEEIKVMMEDLQGKLTKESEMNIAMANDLWRKKFEEIQESKRESSNRLGTFDDDDISDDDVSVENMDGKNLKNKLLDLKHRLKEANTLQEEQAEVLDVQDKEIDELKESNRELEERYQTLFHEISAKWKEEFSESDIIEKIKSHYEMEVDRLHGDIEELQTENSSLKTELDLMSNDFGGGSDGRGRMSGVMRKNSLNARQELKAEVEDHKLQLASLERELQHALNQNERLKLENRSGTTESEQSVVSKPLGAEKKGIGSEVDELRVKLGDAKQEKNRLERELKSHDEARQKVEEELKTKCEEVVLEKQQNEELKKFEEEASLLKKSLEEAQNEKETMKTEIDTITNKLKGFEIRNNNLEKTIKEIKCQEKQHCEELEGLKKEKNDLQTKFDKQISLAKEEKVRLWPNDKTDEVDPHAQDIEVGSRKTADSDEKVVELESALSASKMEFEKLTVKYNTLCKENEERTARIGEIEGLLDKLKTEKDIVRVDYDKLVKKNETDCLAIGEFETTLKSKKEEYKELKGNYEKLVRENESKNFGLDELQVNFNQKGIEYDELKKKCDKLCKEDETKRKRIGELEDELRTTKEKYDNLKEHFENGVQENDKKLSKVEEQKRKLSDTYEKLKKQEESKTSKVEELENTINLKKKDFENLKANYDRILQENNKAVSKLDTEKQEFEDSCEKLRKEAETKHCRIKELETTLKRNKKEFEDMKVKYDRVFEENEGSIEKIDELEAKVEQTETDYEELERNYNKLSEENEGKSLRISELEKENNYSRKQVIAFEKKIAAQEREKKGLEEKIKSLDKDIDEKKDEISYLKQKCETHDLTKTELGANLGKLRDSQDTVNSYESRIRELSRTIEEGSREKDSLLRNQSQLTREITEVKGERDRLEHEKGTLEDRLEKENVEHESKVSGVERKFKEKERVYNETKKQTRHLKEKVKEIENKCSGLQEEIETIKEKHYKEIEKLKETADNAKKSHKNDERQLTEELEKQKEGFEHELLAVKESMTRASQIEVTEVTRELREKLDLEYNRDLQGIRDEMARLNEENHGLKIKLDDMAIEVSQVKEEKYKLEKLKDQFRFQVQSLQASVEEGRDRLSQVQSEQMEVSRTMSEDQEKVVSALKEYETKNAKLVSDIKKASIGLKTVKEKYSKLKEKYVSLSKKYSKLNGEKMNKSDVRVGTDDSAIDLSQIMDELQQSKEETEKANAKLCEEIEHLRQEMGRNEYQIKAVRKANVILMKQSRSLYQESEEMKRIGEERSINMARGQETIESLRQEKDGLEKEREDLEGRVRYLDQEARKANEKCESYFVTKNKKELEYENRNRECMAHCRQLETLKRENDILSHQRKKLQSELDDALGRSRGVVDVNELGEKRTNHPADEGVEPKIGTRVSDRSLVSPRLTTVGSTISESTMSESFDNTRNLVPVLFNNIKKEDEMITDRLDKNAFPASRSPQKDTNLLISRNLMNNEFATDKYLGSTYWETLAFLEKK